MWQPLMLNIRPDIGITAARLRTIEEIQHIGIDNGVHSFGRNLSCNSQHFKNRRNELYVGNIQMLRLTQPLSLTQSIKRSIQVYSNRDSWIVRSVIGRRSSDGMTEHPYMSEINPPF